MVSISDDFATLYISNDLDLDYKIIKPDILTEVVSYINAKEVTVNIQEYSDIHGGNHKISFINSLVNKDMIWRIKINIENLGEKRKLFISFSPEFNGQKVLTKKEVESIAFKDIDFIKSKIGNSISVYAGGQNIIFTSFSYTSENKVDIGDWNINIGQRVVNYRNFQSFISEFLSGLSNNKSFQFRIINLTKYGMESELVSSIINKIDKYGVNLKQVYNKDDYTSIRNSGLNNNIVNIILIEESDQNAYRTSKEFFLNYDVPFQHIKINGDLQDDNIFAFNSAIFEIYKKTHTHDLTLLPDHFSNEPIAGFIYLDVDSIRLNPNTEFTNYLTISYVFAHNLDFSQENLITTNNIKVYSKRDYMNIIEVDKIVSQILSNKGIASKCNDNSSYFNLIVTKELAKKSMTSLIQTLSENGLNVKRLYYVSNQKLKFADNTNYYDSHFPKHPYKIIGKNLAVVKVATNKFLFPQLFSTFVKILYPSDAEISSSDIKSIIWLSKKRIYRAYSLKNITKIEPVAIKDNSSEYLSSIKGPVNINYLI